MSKRKKIRLIDAEKLKKAILHDIEYYETQMPNGQVLINVWNMIDIIDRQPTAYDVDKVIDVCIKTIKSGGIDVKEDTNAERYRKMC